MVQRLLRLIKKEELSDEEQQELVARLKSLGVKLNIVTWEAIWECPKCGRSIIPLRELTKYDAEMLWNLQETGCGHCSSD